ncbi:MAG: hypothetical protein Q7W55_00135, partial [Pseudohongiella sp.]|nr:hypothetical protein [Pseudohongiella sp.]
GCAAQDSHRPPAFSGAPSNDKRGLIGLAPPGLPVAPSAAVVRTGRRQEAGGMWQIGCVEEQSDAQRHS